MEAKLFSRLLKNTTPGAIYCIHYLQQNTNNQDVHFDITNDAIINSERGNTELLGP